MRTRTSRDVMPWRHGSVRSLEYRRRLSARSSASALGLGQSCDVFRILHRLEVRILCDVVQDDGDMTRDGGERDFARLAFPNEATVCILEYVVAPAGADVQPGVALPPLSSFSQPEVY